MSLVDRGWFNAHFLAGGTAPMSTGFWIVGGVFLLAGAFCGALLWMDARSRLWSNRPLYQFILAGALVFTPVMLVFVKVVAGGFANLSPGSL